MAKRKRTRTRGRGGPQRGGQFNRGPSNRHSNHHPYGGHRSPYPREAPIYDPGGTGDRMGEPAAENGEALPLEPFVGVLEMHPNGYGFLRDPKNNYTRERT